MFADVTPVEATEPLGWFTSPWFSTSITLAVLVALAGLTWWLTRGDNFTKVRDVIAGRMRRLLMKRRSASPTPPPVEAPAPQPASKEEAPTPPKEKRPASTDAPAEEAPPWITKALVVIASVPTLLALPWAAYSVAQLLPIPLTIALPLGVLFDVAMVGAVLVALLVPSVSRQASALGWVAAATAAAAIAAHVGLTGGLIFATTPLISKALWGLLIVIRRQQASLRASRVEAERLQKEADKEAARNKEEKDAELSSELTFEQQVEIARLERDALYEQKLAAAKLKLELAKSDAEHQKALAEIERLGEQQQAEDRVEADVYEQRIRLDRKLRTIHGQAPRFAVESGVAEAEVVSEVVPAGVTNRAGFGSGFGFSRPLDVKALTPEGAKVPFEDLPEEHQQLVRYVRVEKKPTVRGAALKLGCDPRTIRSWKAKLAPLGYELPIGDKK